MCRKNLTSDLYEEDYNLWSDQQIAALKNRDVDALDWGFRCKKCECWGRLIKLSKTTHLLSPLHGFPKPLQMATL